MSSISPHDRDRQSRRDATLARTAFHRYTQSIAEAHRSDTAWLRSEIRAVVQEVLTTERERLAEELPELFSYCLDRAMARRNGRVAR